MTAVANLRVRPWTVKRATALGFCSSVHRRRPSIQGAMWCISVRCGDEIVGVALVGWPAKEWTDEELTVLCVLRVAVKEGFKNACSKLYGACWRAARAMGCESMVTYTDLDESGASLRGAGWIEDGTTDGGEWSRPSRPRRKAVNAEPKRRWWAPGSKKLERAKVSA